MLKQIEPNKIKKIKTLAIQLSKKIMQMENMKESGNDIKIGV